MSRRIWRELRRSYVHMIIWSWDQMIIWSYDRAHSICNLTYGTESFHWCYFHLKSCAIFVLEVRRIFALPPHLAIGALASTVYAKLMGWIFCQLLCCCPCEADLHLLLVSTPCTCYCPSTYYCVRTIVPLGWKLSLIFCSPRFWGAFDFVYVAARWPFVSDPMGCFWLQWIMSRKGACFICNTFG